MSAPQGYPLPGYQVNHGYPVQAQPPYNPYPVQQVGQAAGPQVVVDQNNSKNGSNICMNCCQIFSCFSS